MSAKANPFRLGLLAFWGWLCGCGSQPQEGGGGFGGETISGRVVGISGAPLVGVSVRERGARSLDAKPLAQAVTDSGGKFSMEGFPGMAVRLEISGHDGTNAVAALEELDPGRPSLEFVARVAASRTIRIVDSQGHPIAGTLQAYGLGAVASTDDAGVAKLDLWPASDVWVRVTPRNGGSSFDLFVPQRDSSPLTANAGWLLDDFEGGIPKTRLGLLTGGGWWYAAAAGITNSPEGVVVSQEVFGKGYDTTQAHGGRASLHVPFVFSPENPNRFGLVGFHLGVVDGQSVDLSGLDSLVFWHRSNGPLRVDLVVREGGQKRVYAKNLPSAGAWTRVALAKGDFTPVDGGTEWPRSAEHTLYLQFSVYQNTEFWLDDLRLFASRLF